MARTFYNTHWNHPATPRHYYSAVPSSSPATTPSAPARKVVSIPVHYVDSELSVPNHAPANTKSASLDVDQIRSDSAKKIQKVFRGFLVKKSVKKIAGIRKEINEVEKRISMKEAVDLIRSDPKERLKVNEVLMSLLLRLDSVRGLDSGVRDFRKAVIKKAISLQELVDSIDEVLNEDQEAEGEKDDDEAAKQETDCQQLADQPFKSVEPDDVGEVDDIDVAIGEREESVGTNEEEMEADSAESPQGVTMEGDDALEKQQKEVTDEEEEEQGEGAKEEKRKNRKMVERMVEENERMMEMMRELLERNQMQTQVLSRLSHRVEQLEKAFICDKLRRKKRRHASGSIDCQTRKY